MGETNPTVVIKSDSIAKIKATVKNDVLIIDEGPIYKTIPTGEQLIDTNAISLLLKYPNGLPLAGVPYTLEISGSMKNGTTKPDGLLTEEIPATVNEGYLNVNGWHVKISIHDIQPADIVAGAKIRMNNLSFYSDDLINNTITPQYIDALKRFQTFYNIPITGIEDSATKIKLEEQHGF